MKLRSARRQDLRRRSSIEKKVGSRNSASWGWLSKWLCNCGAENSRHCGTPSLCRNYSKTINYYCPLAVSMRCIAIRVMVLHLGVFVSSLVLEIRDRLAQCEQDRSRREEGKYQRIPMHQSVKAEETDGTGTCRIWKSHACARSGR